VQLIADRKLVDPAAPRSGLVEVKLENERTVNSFTKFPLGARRILSAPTV